MAIPDLFQERSYALAVRSLALYRHLLRTTDVPRHLAQQMLRAGTSIAAKLDEAKSAYSRRDLAAKQAIARRECRECRCWLRLITTEQPHAASEVSPILEECTELIAMLTASVRTLRAFPSETASTSHADREPSTSNL